MADVVRYEETFVVVDGLRTRYLQAGRGEPLVLIHGGNIGGYSFANDWDPVIAAFAEQFHVLAPDNLGCGFTDIPPSEDDYRIGALVEHNAALLARLGVGPAHVVGHSRGGYIAARLALDHPHLVDTLTIVDSASLMIPPNPIYLEWEAEASVLTSTAARLKHVMTRNSYSDEHLTDAFVALMADVVESPKSRRAQELLDGGLAVQFKADLVAMQQDAQRLIAEGRLHCPTLVVWALQDPSATMEKCGIPCMELVLGGTSQAEMHVLNHAGHWSFREQPAAFVSAVSAFVRSRSSIGNQTGVEIAG
jgi:pimeloyl-ACP methyl ester carboxylesterase